MAARTAHLQALELATKRNEEAHHREQNRVKILGSRDDSKIYKIRGWLGAKVTEIPFSEGQQKAVVSTKNVALKDSNEILQAVATKSGDGGKANEKSAQKELVGKVSQEAVSGGSIPAISLISSQLPQVLRQHAVPVFRISYGNYEIEPSAIPESSLVEGVITPAATALRSATGISTEGTTAPKKQESSQGTSEVIRAVNPLSVASLKVIPSTSQLSRFSIGYTVPQTLPYVAYDVL
ncbi:hypothetical protein PUN28_005256 [Cardiocondyla obscurior]